jgi:hypothetical protein
MDEITKLQSLYKQMLGPAIDIYQRDRAERGKTRKKKRRKKIFFLLF